MKLLQLFSLPLLTKELIEQAQNKRTYIFRVIYAIVLYGVALVQYDMIGGSGFAGVLNMGSGRRLFDALVMLQASLIFLLIPPITCGALTIEKEKDTLALLLLTKLSPLTIVFEKLLSRVFTMATYQLLSLPLFAIIYGIGGVDLADMLIGVSGLVSLTFLVASISILCSTWFRTTSSAFVSTYLLIFCLLFCLTPFAMFLARLILMRLYSAPNPFGARPSSGLTGDLIRFFFNETFIVVTVFPMLASLLILFAASRVLVRRAFLPIRNLVLEAFQVADRFFTELNRVTTGGIVLVTDQDPLPQDDAITWRETRKKSLGTFRYQFRILMMLMAPLIIAISMTLSDGRMNVVGPVPGFQAFFWIVSIICVTIHATGVIPSERIRQSLDVLLVMPVSSSEIVLQKLSGVRRLILILLVPFTTLLVFQAVWSSYVVVSPSPVDWHKAALKLATMALTSIVYLQLIMWLGFQLGLRMRTQMQAVLATFALVGAACAVPAIIVGPVDFESLDVFFESFSPRQMIFESDALIGLGQNPQALNHNLTLNLIVAWCIFCLHFTIYIGLTWWLRRNALHQFSRIVGRTEPQPEEPTVANELQPVGRVVME
ncbi:ABC transporter permease [Schlesneria paludicola]|uniref:ABC transporter permease n=1 Tax=Schlesneria paludicola TaxID=360056 RepID=UPI000299EA02|nr:hypothetical protein [Schlesneria paludicola]